MANEQTPLPENEVVAISMSQAEHMLASMLVLDRIEQRVKQQHEMLLLILSKVAPGEYKEEDYDLKGGGDGALVALKGIEADIQFTKQLLGMGKATGK
ncbi:hypothetical protein F0P96_10525 [Hymenobacter busanensis]|uniref:Uncharacterized protein n=1 Tax=Hymenobacter busanensis TaxID=2607656 RepID=A0A7L4ZYK3_9BACT|nr:hypothetical protein [Hymenobacter busanensis]KAA9333395.1 hypothetical protein F0P96_10525 [Hymenobacter busanensis]QHJ07925.1 hypothetical protein GUY19_11780 [Hymenobacter busanensis]